LSSQAIQEAEIRKITVLGQAEKFVRPHLNGKNLDMVAHACHFSNSMKHKIGGTQSSLAWGKSKTLSPKYPT
jgi:hypothetical protein